MTLEPRFDMIRGEFAGGREFVHWRNPTSQGFKTWGLERSETRSKCSMQERMPGSNGNVERLQFHARNVSIVR